MNWVDLILNIAGLLMWINWRAGRFDPIGNRIPATLVGTLRSTQSIQIQKFQRWSMPIFLSALLLLRACLYYAIGPALRWAGTIDLGVISLSFRSDWFGRILLFSVLSFMVALGIFYSCLLLLSLLKGPKPLHDFVRMQLGRIDGWPRSVKFILPLVVTAVFWYLLSWALAWLHVIPQPVSETRRVGESLIIALQAYLLWKFPIALLLVLYLLNNYIYFGRHPLWNYTNVTGEILLSPLKRIPFLRLGRVDFAPVVGIVLVFVITTFAALGLHKLYSRL